MMMKSGEFHAMSLKHEEIGKRSGKALALATFS